MPLKYGSTTIEKVVYNGVDLNKVYFGSTLVFTKSKIFTGGNGSQIFDIVHGYTTNSSTYPDTNQYNQYDVSTMTATMRYEIHNLTYRGYADVRTKSTYDISLWSNATFKLKMWQNTRKDWGPNATCYVLPNGSTSGSNYSQAYQEGTDQVERNVVVSLTTPKATSNDAKFRVYQIASKSSGTAGATTYCQLMSITLS